MLMKFAHRILSASERSFLGISIPLKPNFLTFSSSYSESLRSPPRYLERDTQISEDYHSDLWRSLLKSPKISQNHLTQTYESQYEDLWRSSFWNLSRSPLNLVNFEISECHFWNRGMTTRMRELLQQRKLQQRKLCCEQPGLSAVNTYGQTERTGERERSQIVRIVVDYRRWWWWLYQLQRQRQVASRWCYDSYRSFPFFRRHSAKFFRRNFIYSWLFMKLNFIWIIWEVKSNLLIDEVL